MTRYEFLNDLKASLTGNVSAQVISENMQYYDEYIAGEIRKGKTEAETLNALGDPRLIARTIIDTKGDNYAQSTYADESWEEEGGAPFNSSAGSKEKKTNSKKTVERKGMSEETARKIRIYFIIALTLILIVLVVGFIVTAVGAILYIFWPVLVVLLVVHIMTRNNRYR